MRNIVEYEIWILGDDEFIDTEVLVASKTNKTEALQYAEYFSNKENYAFFFLITINKIYVIH